jgi:hypothetical protein
MVISAGNPTVLASQVQADHLEAPCETVASAMTHGACHKLCLVAGMNARACAFHKRYCIDSVIATISYRRPLHSRQPREHTTLYLIDIGQESSEELISTAHAATGRALVAPSPSHPTCVRDWGDNLSAVGPRDVCTAPRADLLLQRVRCC